MENINKKFIITKDEESKKILSSNGLTEISQNNGIYIFLNEPNKLVRFNYLDINVSFTDKLYF